MELETQRMLRLLLGAVTLAVLAWGLWAIVGVLDRGPDANRFRVYVLFKDVQGLQTGSRVVHRGMTVGSVAALELDPQGGRVRVLVALDREARVLVKTTTELWVVRPRFTSIQTGASGLDTLIKESYLRLRVRRAGEPLGEGQELLGLERPPPDLAREDLDDPMVGDLLATVKLPEAYGLEPGSPVVFRGKTCGEVRGTRLSAEGRGVLVRFRILRAYRRLCREGSRFWVARPIFEGSLFTGMTVRNLGSVFEGALVFDTPASSSTEPMPDNALITGLAGPPSGGERWEGKGVRAAAAAAPAGTRGGEPATLSPWVEVRYHAVEKDTISSDDEVEAHGEGVLFRNAKGELCALCARSSCDGRFLLTDSWFDRLRIANERIRVVLADGRVWPANRVWVDTAGLDLAVLRLQTPAGAAPAPLPGWESYLDFTDEGAAAAAAAPAGGPRALLREGGRAWGLVGQAKADARKRVVASFASIPPPLRPPAR